jgi:hypothetical protein
MSVISSGGGCVATRFPRSRFNQKANDPSILQVNLGSIAIVLTRDGKEE